MTEEYFPRGGKKPNVTYFKQSSNFLGAAEKGQGKKKKQKKKSDNDDGYLSDEALKEVDQSYKMCAAGIGQKTIKPGVNILGRVRRAMDTKLLVSLPSKLDGTVMACHISQAYNKLLEAYVNDETEKVRELGEIFRPGQYLALQVLEADASGDAMLSAMPQHVNGARTHADLKKGDILQAAVSSVEDHGYVMDLGIANTTAFLAKADANPDIELDAGVLIWTCVKSHTANAESSIVALSGALPALQKALRRKRGALQPGSAVEFTVVKPLDNGIEGRVFGGTTAYIQRFHADNSKGKKPTLGQKLRAHVLYVMPTRNEPFLTTRDIFESSYPDLSEEMAFKEGDIIEEAQVLKIASRSIHFKLGKRCIGTMSLKRLAVDEDLSDEQVIAQSYPIGSTHRVRVLTYNMSDYIYHVSDQPAVLSERYFSLDQLPAGARALGTVRSVGERYITVAIGRLNGVVMQTHLSDAGVYVDPKKASSSNLTKKKYKVGQEVSVRVLSCDPARQNLQLTLKPSLLAEDIEVLASYDQVEVGKSYTGFIKVVKDYVLVGFFDTVVAYVPADQVCSPPVDTLADSFHPGQIVNCTIMKVDKEKKKMHGSLIKPPFWPATKPPYVGKRKNESEDSESSETPKKKRKSNDAAPEDTEDSDEPKRKNFLQVLKSALQEEGSSGLSSYEQAEIGKNYTGFVKVVKDYVLVGFLGGVVAYVPRSHASDPPVETLADKFQLGQIVKCTILKLTPEEKRMLGSLVIPPFWPAEKAPFTGKSNDETKDGEAPMKKRKLDDIEDSDGKNKKDKRNKKVNEVSEESDAIETDIYEDSDQVLTKEDKALIDLSNCETLKQWRKRVVSLGKFIKYRLRRIDRIEKKIANIEEQGLTPDNKKYHTAMHQEILVIKERLKKLVEALDTAQEKLSKLEEESGDPEKHKKKMAEINKLKAEIVKKDEPSQDSKKKEKKNKNKSDTVTDEIEAEEKPKKAKEVKVKVKKDKEVIVDKSKEIKVVESLEPALEVPSAKDFWSENADDLAKNVQEESSSSSEDEEKEQPKKKRKKLSAAEKDAKARAEEERLRELERRAADDSQPRSSDQFERALLANPNCSQLWVAYMAFHLQATEIDKARAVGRRALNTISFREEDEKLNVWLAMLNFEHRFGTKESQQKTLEDALQMNDTFKIHSKLLDILAETSKPQELSTLVDLMMKKHKRDPQCYILCGQACFKTGLVDKARHVMQKAISVLEKKEHVLVLVQFALLERAWGSRGRAEALFEQVLAVYPQRVDVAAAYTDMLAKARDMEQLRQVMERMTSHKLPARKIKVLYNKWIELEERAGNTEKAEEIRERAVQFIEKAKF